MESKNLYKQSDQVTGYIFDFALGTLFHFFPRTGPQFVSIHSLHKISKYKGKEGETPRLNKLGPVRGKK